MAIDFTNPQVTNRFYQKAIQAGYKPAEVDKFVQQQQQFAAQENSTRAAEAGLFNNEQAKGALQYGGPNVLSTLLDMKQKGTLPANAIKEPGSESGADAKLIGTLDSGFKSLEGMRKILENPETKNFDQGNMAILGAKTKLVPWGIGGMDLTPWGRSLESYMYNAADIILRFRTGAQANPTEIEKFARINMPGVTDTPSVRKQKWDLIKTELESVAKAMGYQSPYQVSSEDGFMED